MTVVHTSGVLPDLLEDVMNFTISHAWIDAGLRGHCVVFLRQVREDGVIGGLVSLLSVIDHSKTSPAEHAGHIMHGASCGEK